MTRAQLITLATLGSVGLLIGVYVFQYFGWAPCKLCLWQRWPHFAAVAIGALALFALRTQQIILAGLGMLATLATAAIAAYHTGVERKWWEGPSSCTGAGGGLGDLSAADLVPGASDAPTLVLCDSFTPFLFGLSMANWNLIASLGLAVIWLTALKRAS